LGTIKYRAGNYLLEIKVDLFENFEADVVFLIKLFGLILLKQYNSER